MPPTLKKMHIARQYAAKDFKSHLISKMFHHSVEEEFIDDPGGFDEEVLDDPGGLEDWEIELEREEERKRRALELARDLEKPRKDPAQEKDTEDRCPYCFM